jgi:uncharacterized protein
MLGTVILGGLWAGWHLPLFLSGWAMGGAGIGIIVQFVVFTMVLNIVVTWFFNNARGSLLVVMLFHSNINNFGSVLWPSFFPSLPVVESRYLVGLVGFGTVALVIVIATRGRLGYRRSSTMVSQSRLGPSAEPVFLGR